MKAVWNNTTLAQSNDTIVIEGNHYFPPSSVHHELLTPSATPYTCPWRGTCTYYHIHANSQTLKDGALTYLHPKEGAAEKAGHEFAGYIAFSPQVEVSE